MIAKNGSWQLIHNKKTLSKGTIVGFDGAIWHQLKIKFQDKDVEVFVDNKPVTKANHIVSSGYVSFASSYHHNLFDNLEITAND